MIWLKVHGRMKILCHFKANHFGKMKAQSKKIKLNLIYFFRFGLIGGFLIFCFCLFLLLCF